MRRMASAAAAKKCPRPSQRTVVGRADQPEVRLVNQGGGLEGVVGGLGGHARGGELPQLVVDEREQVGGGLAVTGRGGVEEASHIGHSAECNRYVRERKEASGTELPADPSRTLTQSSSSTFGRRFPSMTSCRMRRSPPAVDAARTGGR